MALGEFDRGARFADATEAVDGSRGGTRGDGGKTLVASMLGLAQRGADLVEESVAAFEQRAQRFLRQVVGLEARL